jgi:hypothetical protein
LLCRYAKYWMATPLVVIIALLPDLLNRAFRRLYVPEGHFAVQEFEHNSRAGLHPHFS